MFLYISVKIIDKTSETSITSKMYFDSLGHLECFDVGLHLIYFIFILLLLFLKYILLLFLFFCDYVNIFCKYFALCASKNPIQV